MPQSAVGPLPEDVKVAGAGGDRCRVRGQVAAEVLPTGPAVSGDEAGIPEVIVGAAPEHVLGAVGLCDRLGRSAEPAHAQRLLATPAEAGGVLMPQPTVGALPERIDRAGN